MSFIDSVVPCFQSHFCCCESLSDMCWSVHSPASCFAVDWGNHKIGNIAKPMFLRFDSRIQTQPTQFREGSRFCFEIDGHLERINSLEIVCTRIEWHCGHRDSHTSRLQFQGATVRTDITFNHCTYRWYSEISRWCSPLEHRWSQLCHLSGHNLCLLLSRNWIAPFDRFHLLPTLNDTRKGFSLTTTDHRSMFLHRYLRKLYSSLCRIQLLNNEMCTISPAYWDQFHHQDWTQLLSKL